MYNAVLTTVTKIRNHPNADKLNLATVLGYQVVVGKDMKEGDRVVFFEAGGQLSEDFCKFNNLYREAELNSDKTKTGLFEKNRRIRPVRLRGEVSDGYLVPVSQFNYLGYLFTQEDGFTFSELNGVEICCKYETPKQIRNRENAGKARSVKRGETVMFKKHIETEKWKQESYRINSPGMVYITEKIHGTCLSGNTPITMEDGTKKQLNQITIGEKVLGYENGKVVCSRVLDTFNTPNLKKWLYVKGLRKGISHGNYYFKLHATEDHKFYVKKSTEDSYNYIELKDIKSGDSILYLKSGLEVSPIQKSFILGKLLGDGYLLRRKYTASLTFGHKQDHKQYVEWGNEILGSLAGSVIDKYISGYGTPMSRTTTKESVFLTEFAVMYQTGRKEISKEILKYTTPLTLAVWYMDDGSLSRSFKQEDRCTFATCGFTEETCQNLLEMLKIYKIDAKLQKSFNKKRNKTYYRIRLNKESADLFFNLIYQYIPPIMQYKLPEKYRNQYNPSLLKDEVGEQLGFVTIEVLVDEVKEEYPESTRNYDITTETGNFFAKDILVHNSHRMALCLDEIPTHELYSGVKKIFFKFFKSKDKTKIWKYLHGSRNVIINDGVTNSRNSFYGDDEFRYKVTKGITLHKGEVIYGEIVGYVNEHTPIMSDQSLKVIESEKDYLNQKELNPNTIYRYSYGCKPGECKFYVYRIVHTNEDGNQVELSWPQVKARCHELGIDYVPELVTYYHDGSEESKLTLESIVQSYTDGGNHFYSTLDNTHLKEGIIVRFSPESGDKEVILKSKAWLFLTLEHGLRDKPDFLDMEEMA